jgi:hypothetical protein
MGYAELMIDRKMPILHENSERGRYPLTEPYDLQPSGGLYHRFELVAKHIGLLSDSVQDFSILHACFKFVWTFYDHACSLQDYPTYSDIIKAKGSRYFQEI